MAKQKQVSQKKVSDEGGKFVPHNIKAMNPKRDSDQMAPTPQEPMRQRYKLAGGC